MSRSSGTGLKILWSPLANNFVKKYYVVSGLFPILKQTGDFSVRQAAHLILRDQNILIFLKSEPKQLGKMCSLIVLWAHGLNDQRGTGKGF